MKFASKMTNLVLSKRFMKFCAVGSSGVLVNLGSLFLLADLFEIHANLSAAIAIVISINTNFCVNELWTFRDRRRGSGSIVRRWMRFHLVSMVGALLQWLMFVCMNYFVALILDLGSTSKEGVAESISSFWSEVVVSPRDVGGWKYLSQMIGIGVATLWNFFANLFWTWNTTDQEENDG